MIDPLELAEFDSVLLDNTKEVKRQMELIEAAICSDIAMVLLKYGIKSSQKMVKVRFWEMGDLDKMFSCLDRMQREGSSNEELGKASRTLLSMFRGLQEERKKLVHKDYPYGDE